MGSAVGHELCEHSGDDAKDEHGAEAEEEVCNHLEVVVSILM